MHKNNQVENLYSFAKLYGYIRFFYPGDEASKVNWDKFLIYGIDSVIKCKTRGELLNILKELFLPIAPLMSFSTSTFKLPHRKKGHVNVFYLHHGFGPKKNSYYKSYRVGRDKIPNILTEYSNKPFENFVIKDIGNGFVCTIPLVLNLPKEKQNKFSENFCNLKKQIDKVKVDYEFAEDRNTRISSIIISWNILKHSYPYYDVVKVDMDKVLRSAIKETLIKNKTTEDCFWTLNKMISRIKDGHGYVSHGNLPVRYFLPVIFDLIENRIVVKYSATRKLKAGDILLEIDGENGNKLLREKLLYASGSKQLKLSFAFWDYGSSKFPESKLKINRDGRIKTFLIKRFGKDENNRMYRNYIGEGFKKYPDEIFYIIPNKVKMDVVRKHINNIAKAKGLVIDMRWYPFDHHLMFSHMTRTALTSSKWNVPIIKYPDYKNMTEFNTSGRWNIKPKAPFIKAKIVYLTNGNAISYAESCMSIVKFYKLGTIIGSETAGANGNVNRFSTPGGFGFMFTGMKVLNHDDSQHHLIGVKPDIKMKPTFKGIREKRDELLEKAFEVIKNS